MKVWPSILLLVCCCGAVAQTGPTLEQVLIDKQKQLTEAEKRHDKAYVTAQLAQEFNEISPDGKISDRASALANFDFARIEQYDLSAFKVIPLAADIGIVTFIADVKGTFHGEPASGRMYVSSTWINQGGWKLRFAQVTPLAPAANSQSEPKPAQPEPK